MGTQGAGKEKREVNTRCMMLYKSAIGLKAYKFVLIAFRTEKLATKLRH